MSETVGAALKAARERRRLTLAQVSESTKLRTHYLLALENDDISAMPSAAQARGFLRLYADFLGLDLETLIPAPSAAPSGPPAEAETEANASAAASTKSGLPQLLTDLRGRIASRLASKAAADDGPSVEPPDAQAATPTSPSKTTQPPAPAADKKKLSP